MNVANALTKTEAWHENRKSGIGGSEANIIMAGDAERLIQLWLEKRGEAEPDNLDDILAVQMGSWTEPLNLHWFGKQTGMKVTTENLEVRHPFIDWMRAELDGRVGQHIVECKHTSAYAKSEEIITRYYWQCQHQMLAANTDKAYLSVFYGNNKWEYYEIDADQAMQAKLIEAERQFWACVKDGTAPAVKQEKVSVSFDDMKEADMTGNNEWADFAATWKENKAAEVKFKKADKGLKDMVEADVKLASGHGVQVTRSKSGSRTVKEIK